MPCIDCKVPQMWDSAFIPHIVPWLRHCARSSEYTVGHISLHPSKVKPSMHFMYSLLTNCITPVCDACFTILELTLIQQVTISPCSTRSRYTFCCPVRYSLCTVESGTVQYMSHGLQIAPHICDILVLLTVGYIWVGSEIVLNKRLKDAMSCTNVQINAKRANVNSRT